MTFGLNDFVNVGASGRTVTHDGCTPLLRFTGFAMLPAALVNAGGFWPQLEFTCCGAFVTLTAMVQVDGEAVLCATTALLTVIDAAPATAVTVPPQPFTTVGAAATRRPDGRLSVNDTVCAGLLVA